MNRPEPASVVRAEELIGQLLIGFTNVSVVLLLLGVGLLTAAGISPMAGGPGLDVGRLPADLLRLDPNAFLWLGLLAILVAPIARVALALIAYGRDRDWLMVAVSVAILVVIMAAVGSALLATV